jgi:hypothetical protein
MRCAIYAVLCCLLTIGGRCSLGLQIRSHPFSVETIKCLKTSEEFIVIPGYARGAPIRMAPDYVEMAKHVGFKEFIITVTPDPAIVADQDPEHVASAFVLFALANKIPLNQIWLEVSSNHWWKTNHTNNLQYVQRVAAKFTQLGSRPTILSSRRCWRKIVGDNWSDRLLEYDVISKDEFPSNNVKHWQMYDFGSWSKPSAIYLSSEHRCNLRIGIISKS